ncbi:MAG: hypothetical protein VXZ96_16030 [Myxococcota bacterium]|nr:hypothetical protein [Myxococcota bacterium]MEC8381839.1 hypothetical protein [Myxococcota bacterium]
MTGADDANFPYIVAISCMVALMLISMLIAIGIIKDKERFTKVIGGAVVVLGGGGLVYVIGYTMAYVAMSTDYINNDIEGFAECVAKEKVSDAPVAAPAEGQDGPTLSPKEEVRASCCYYLEGVYTVNEDGSEGQCVYTERPWSLEGEAVAAADEASTEATKEEAPVKDEKPEAASDDNKSEEANAEGASQKEDTKE